MTDHISKEHRSWNMARIKSGDTKPEITVRSFLHTMGFRFRLNGKVSKKYHPKGVLPGKPDIVLARYKTVIFVHGCFWHRHKGCKKSNIPKSNKKYWVPKLEKNVHRDKITYKELDNLGWKTIILWECKTKSLCDIKEETRKLLNEKKA